MDKKELNDLIDRVALTDPGGVDKVKKILKELANNSGSDSDGGDGSGSDSSLSDMTDVDISSPSDGDTLVYNATTGKWENGSGGGGCSCPSPMVVEGFALDRRVDNVGQFSFIPKSDEASFQEAINQLDAGGLLYLKTNVGVSPVNSSEAKEAKYAITGYNADMIWSTAITYQQGRSYGIVWDKQAEPTIIVKVDYDNADYTQPIDGGSLLFWFINYDGNITMNDEVLLSINNFSLNIIELMPAEGIPEGYLYLEGEESNSEYMLAAGLMNVPTAVAFFEDQGLSLNIPEDCNYVIFVTVMEIPA